MRTFARFVLALSGTTACGSTDEVERVPAEWWLHEAPTHDRLRLTVHIGSGSCNSFDELFVTEFVSEVRVEAFVKSRRGDLCVLDDVMKVESVRLAALLGGRRLVGCFVPPSHETVPGPDLNRGVQCADRIASFP